jgi:hypothetical protein
MHPRSRELIDSLDDRRAELQRAVDEIPVPLRNRQPASDRWSVADVLEHLALLEERIGSCSRGNSPTHAKGLGPERDSSPVGPTFELSQIVDRTRRLVASETAQPRSGVDVISAWGRLERAREATRDALSSADGLALCEVMAPHPVLGHLNLLGSLHCWTRGPAYGSNSRGPCGARVC